MKMTPEQVKKTLHRWDEEFPSLRDAVFVLIHELTGLQKKLQISEADYAAMFAQAHAASVKCDQLRARLEWVKHLLPPSTADELTEWLDRLED